jgi:uncharacterized protein DUF4339
LEVAHPDAKITIMGYGEVCVMASTSLFIFRAGQEHGPISEEAFRELVNLGQLEVDDLVRYEGAIDWLPVAPFFERLRTDANEPLASSVDQAGQAATPEGDALAPARRRRINGGTIFWGVIIVVIIGVAASSPGSIPYRWAGAINGAIFGAIAGGLVALLHYLIKKKLKIAPISITMIVGFIAGQALESSINFLGGVFYDQRVKPAVTETLFSQQLDGMPIYQALKRADPEAYYGLRSELLKRVANGASGRDIETYSETYTASFRRANADVALAAPSYALAALMQTLIDILNYLHSLDETLCREYVLQAFGSERIRALARQSAFSALVQRQATAVFDTIAQGRKYRQVYEPVAEADIQLAIQELQRRGWSEQMRAALAEPNQLRTLPAGLVCRIRREWLAIIASLPDPARTRWYREVLGPLLRS